MAIIKQVYDTTDNSVIIVLDNLAFGTQVASSFIDNTIDKFLGIELEIEIIGSNIASDGTVDLYMARSNDGINFNTDILLNNLLFIGSVTQNGTTAVRKVLRIEQIPAYFKLIAKNSDAAYNLGAIGNNISYRGVDLSNA